MTAEVWRDPAVPVGERVGDLMSRMTVPEKVAQLFGIWVGIDSVGGDVAPHQHELATPPEDWDTLIRDGIGQLTRPFGTRPVEPAAGARAVARTQRQIMEASRFGIPAVVHEEILTGLAAWQATIYPSPLCWGASFDPALVERMGAQIGRTMRRLGVHQGLAPVLDVVRDLRWGRVEETIGEDPYLVGVIGSAYVRGVESAGVIATLKHFAGYSASRAGRNLAPVSIGKRELADVMLPPFEMALRAGVRSVMNAYVDLDGVPAASDPALFTELLRDTYGFTGTVVADYFAITFLETLHNVAGSPGEAAALALKAGIDVELPTVKCFGQPLLDAIEAGLVDLATIDRALERVLRQKCELGLLDADWSPEPPALTEGMQGTDAEDAQGTEGVERADLDGSGRDGALRDGASLAGAGAGVDGAALDGIAGGDSSRGGIGAADSGFGTKLDDAEARSIARELAQRSIVLLRNEGALPLASGGRIAVVGPRAHEASAMLGCYSFPLHVGVNHPDVPIGVEVPTLLETLREDAAGYHVSYVQGVPVLGGDDAGIDEAVRAASGAEVCVAVLGDKAGLFGAGTSGEGCDAPDLRLPGRQEELLEALLATGTPVVLVLLAGRPYELSRQVDRLSAVVCGFFPGEEGARALADVLSGRVNPSGRLPVSFPAAGGSQPSTYLAAPLGHVHGASTVDTTALFPFGHGLSYAPATWGEIALGSSAQWPTDGTCTVSVALSNDAQQPTSEVVQIYLHDPVAEVARPVQRLIAAARVDLAPGEARTVTVELHADLASYTGRAGRRQVDPGEVELRIGASSTDIRETFRLTMTGERREVGFDRVMEPTTVISASVADFAASDVAASNGTAPEGAAVA